MIPCLLCCLIGAAIAACHVLSVKLSLRGRTVATTVGVCLHVPLFLSLLYAEASMEVAVAAFLGSITLYTVCAAWRAQHDTRVTACDTSDTADTAEERREEADA